MEVHDRRFESVIDAILADKGGVRLNGKVASVRTANVTREVMKTAMRTLWDLGMRLTHPVNFEQRHMRALVRHYWFDRKKSPQTMQNEMSRMRIFFGYIGKDGFVKPLPFYLPDVAESEFKVKTVANNTKSWSGNQVDVAEKIRQAEIIDWRFGLMILMELTFGLRRREVIVMKPHRADEGTELRIFPGEAKGGRPRLIPIKTELQRGVLDHVKSRLRVGESIGWKVSKFGQPVDMEYCLKRYQNLMARLGITKAESGVTGHGLRAQFAENEALRRGFAPPTLGGKNNQMPAEELRLKQHGVIQALGHNNLNTAPSYYGSFKGPGRNLPIDPERLPRLLEDAKAALSELSLLERPSIEYAPDCLAIRNALKEFGCDLKADVIAPLWRLASRRHGVECMSPATNIHLLMEVAANQLLGGGGGAVHGDPLNGQVD